MHLILLYQKPVREESRGIPNTKKKKRKKKKKKTKKKKEKKKKKKKILGPSVPSSL